MSNKLPIDSAPLETRRLRALSLDPGHHPRGQPHLSAASGLVCAHGRAYVVADDEHHLAVFRDLHGPGALHRIVAGDLPQGKKARKRRKPDLETLVLLPAWRTAAGGALLALGSGSRPNRHTGVVMPLDADGEPARRMHRFDLAPLYATLRAQLGEINIEGAMVQGDEFILLNRGIGGRTDNATAHYALADVLTLIEGGRAGLEPGSIRRYELGDLDGVPLGFTDAAALPDGSWVFTAAAEDTDDSVADGAFTGSVVGRVDARGRLQSMHRLAQPVKAEGIGARAGANGIELCMVTDADDPKQGSWLLMATLPSVVTLREVTADTVRAVCKLVAKPAGFVAPNSLSIAQAYFHPEAWFRAVVLGDEPIGFVMLSDSSQKTPPPAELEVMLWRFMIDVRHKRKGHGRAALRLVIDEVRRRHPTLATFATSCVPGAESPRPFYESLGFVFSGEMDEDEEVLVLDLRPSPHAGRG